MDEQKSPYAPPGSSVEVTGQTAAEFNPAGKWRRFFNLLIDYLAMVVLVFAMTVAIGLTFGESGIHYLESVPDFGLGILLTLLYYIPCEYLTDRTLGKLITGTRVVAENGLKPSFKQILGRSFARLVPFEPFSFFGWEGRGWHDRWPKTYVIHCR